MPIKLQLHLEYMRYVNNKIELIKYSYEFKI